MRRLFATIYECLLGIRTITAKQHVEDLRKMLNDLREQRAILDAEIEHIARRLADAHLRLQGNPNE